MTNNSDGKLTTKQFESVAAIIRDDMKKMSGLILWRVTGEWAHCGRKGELDVIVEATTATEAIATAWAGEDDRDLRTVHAEWLCPIESVVRAADAAGGE